MPSVKLKVELIDKHQVFPMKATYDPELRIAQVQRTLRRAFPTRFIIDPNHIYQRIHGKKSEFVAYVDNASRSSIPMDKAKKLDVEDNKTNGNAKGKKTENAESNKENVEVGESIQVHTDKQVDGKTKNVLDYLIEERFWKSLIAKAKLPLSTVIILLCAGGGIFYLIRDVLLPLFGIPV